MGDVIQLSEANYFGDCPECGRNDGYVNIGRGHWFICKEHKAMWFIGSNLFSDWKGETEEEQRERFDFYGLGSYEEVKPWHRWSQPEFEERPFNPGSGAPPPELDDGIPF